MKTEKQLSAEESSDDAALVGAVLLLRAVDNLNFKQKMSSLLLLRLRKLWCDIFFCCMKSNSMIRNDTPNLAA